MLRRGQGTHPAPYQAAEEEEITRRGKSRFPLATTCLIHRRLGEYTALAAIREFAVVLPVLAHSTWHLYRKVVEPDLSSRLDRHREAKGRRYAADFPAVLLPWTHEDEP